MDTALIQQGSTVLNAARNLEIDTPERCDDASIFLNKVLFLKSKVEETFDPLIQQSFSAHKQAVAKKQEFMAPLEEAETLIKNQILKFLDAFSAKAEEGLVDDGEYPIVLATQNPITGFHLRKHYKWEVEDLELVPMEFLKVDEAAIRKRINSMKENAGIPGIKITVHRTLAKSK